VLPSNAHRPALVVRVFPPADEAHMPLVDLVVFMDGRNDIIETLTVRGPEPGIAISSIWRPQVAYEMAGGVNSWHWSDECAATNMTEECKHGVYLRDPHHALPDR